MSRADIERMEKRKRKRADEDGATKKSTKRRTSTADDAEDEIRLLEAKMAKGGNVDVGATKLLEIMTSQSSSQQAAAVALCRIFYRLIVSDGLVKRKAVASEEKVAIERLRTTFRAYIEALCGTFQPSDEDAQSTAFTLVMRLVKAEASQTEARAAQAWRTGAFSILILSLVSSESLTRLRQDFVESFVEEYDDVRYFTFVAISNILSSQEIDHHQSRSLVSGSLDLLFHIEGIPESKDQLEDWYGSPPESPSNPLLSLSAHKKVAQDAWQAIFRSHLDKTQRKRILGVFTEKVAPWFSRPETLMDFLTDSYNQSGATSLLALEGIYYLIKTRNLDYPHFYHKLYSLLDDDILRSKHRAKVFRLLETFLSSTHLPAALVASFVKRLSRLALHAPPGGIVMVIPWIYNIFRLHPQCTFMIHRVVRDQQKRAELEESGMDDPFKMAEEDPMETSALDSSLWEIQTLQHHYHPNVATLAKIISEQFTKQEYSLDDFLDHTYDGLIDAELGKDMKKAPVVEFEIPKRILTSDDGGLNELGLVLQQAVTA